MGNDKFIFVYNKFCIYNVTREKYLGGRGWYSDFSNSQLFDSNGGDVSKSKFYKKLDFYIGHINKHDVLLQVKIENNLPNFLETIILDNSFILQMQLI